MDRRFPIFEEPFAPLRRGFSSRTGDRLMLPVNQEVGQIKAEVLFGLPTHFFAHRSTNVNSKINFRVHQGIRIQIARFQKMFSG